jgi:hypothetical protein
MRRLVTVLIAALLLALPSAALAQSAGDEQYADPFEQPQQEPSGGQDEPAPAPEPAPEPAPAPAESSQTATATQAEVAQPTGSQTLPATGLPVALLAGAGGLLLTGGTMLRLRLS